MEYVERSARGGFVVALLALLTLAAFPGIGAADSKRVVLLQSMPVLPVLNHSQAFVAHLQKLGYAPGRNLQLVVLEAEGDRQRAETLLRQALAAGRPDLVVSSATLAAQAAQAVLRDSGIPQLFFTVSDPVGAGLVPRLGVPGDAPITGKLHTVARATKIEMVLRVLKLGGKRVRFGMVHSDYSSAAGDARLLKEAARDFPNVDFVFFSLPFRPIPEGLPAMLDDMQRGVRHLEELVDFWWQPAGPLGERAEYTRLLREHSRHAVVFGTNMDSVRLGALLHLTPSDEATGREAAQLAVAILQGEPAGAFPVTPPAGFDLGINLATALQLGVAVPSDLVELAGKHIFREQAP